MRGHYYSIKPLPNGSETLRIELTKGKEAIVDAQYYLMLMTMGSWCVQCNRYAASRIRGRLWLMHDLIMYWHTGHLAPQGCNVDHKNGNGFDNRLQNLRYATYSDNAYNKPLSSRNTSGYRGVYWSVGSQKWFSQIRFKGKTYYLGMFTNKRAAAKAYNTALQELAGEFGRPNTL